MGTTQQMLLSTGPAADPYYANVSLLLHMDGLDGGTVFTDQKGHAFTAHGATTSATAPKFGSSSASFSAGGWIDTPDSSDFTLGAGDFTFEAWIKTSTGGVLNICGQYDGSDVSTIAQSLYLNAGVIQADSYSGAVAEVTLRPASPTINDGNWHHVAVARSGSTFNLFSDGVLIATASYAGSLNDSPTVFSIGRAGAWSSNTFTGNVDEFRFTKGVARYTANFTPSTIPFSGY